MNADTISIVERILSATPVADTPAVADIPTIKPEEDTKPKTPPMYAVLLHNDGSTSPYFVMDVLRDAFSITESRKQQSIMMAAHTTGKSVVKIVSLDMAETQLARANAIIAGAQSGKDYNAPTSKTGACELLFTIELETKGE